MESAKPENAEESQEERIAWLRDRGVEINIPGESADAKKATAGRTLTIVKIPSNASEPYADVTVSVDDSSSSDQLLTLLKPRFMSAENIREDALRRAAEGLLHSGEAATSLTAGKDRLSDMLRGEGHVEAFSLTRPAASNDWVGVTAYLDEAGQLKGLPVNKRASALASFCGFDNIQLLGDIYIGRIVRPGGSSKPRHVDFTMAEVDSSSAWVRSAHRDNYQHGVSAGRVTMDDSSGGSAPLGAEIASSDPGKPYKWSQTEESVDVTFSTLSFGDGAASKREISVDIKSKHLKIVHKALGVMLDIELSAAIKASESTWSISGSDIEVSMEKAMEIAWSQLEKT